MKDMIMSDTLVRITFFIYGLCIGSFLNVCILRLPKSMSLIKPSSTCPKCGTSIRFYDNIPVLSYLILGGKCRTCKNPISYRYPLVELTTGIIWVFSYMMFGLTAECFVYSIFVSTLLVITMIDFDHRIIPDVISLPGIPVFFIGALLINDIGWLNSILGIIAGGGSLLLVAQVYMMITKQEGMGGGDIKLLAMIGAMIGWKGVFFTIFVSSAVGTVVGLVVMIITRKNLKLAVPFGPFLSIGAVVYVYFGRAIILWYEGVIGILPR